ncbi:hypothetical protein AA105894_1906 [Asaia spathodeae NBRC 105894]|nr:hypothetical protein AA105894_1906 [Asaia spathodeae NBRC 105894]
MHAPSMNAQSERNTAGPAADLSQNAKAEAVSAFRDPEMALLSEWQNGKDHPQRSVQPGYASPHP